MTDKSGEIMSIDEMKEDRLKLEHEIQYLLEAFSKKYKVDLNLELTKVTDLSSQIPKFFRPRIDIVI